MLAPGDLVEPDEVNARLWKTGEHQRAHGSDVDTAVATMLPGQQALVLSVGFEYAFVLFGDIAGYVYKSRLKRVPL